MTEFKPIQNGWSATPSSTLKRTGKHRARHRLRHRRYCVDVVTVPALQNLPATMPPPKDAVKATTRRRAHTSGLTAAPLGSGVTLDLGRGNEYEICIADPV